MSAAPLATPPANDRARPLTGLVSDLVHETTALFRKEVELAKVELTEKAGLLAGGLQRAALGGALLFTGLLFILAAVALALALVLPPWAAALAVGVPVAGAGLIALLSGRRALARASSAPERTVRTLIEDKAWANSHFGKSPGDAARPPAALPTHH
jgi:hypothetical protein